MGTTSKVTNVTEFDDVLTKSLRAHNENKSGLLKVTWLGDSYPEKAYGFVVPATNGVPNFIMHENAGVGGDTTQQILDRPSSVPSDTDVCIINGGTNDAIALIDASVTARNIKGLILDSLLRNERPILLATPPSDTATSKPIIREQNLFKYFICLEMGVQFIDPFSQFCDGDGGFAAGASYDGDHLNDSHMKIAGLQIANDINNSVQSLPLGRDNANNGLVVNGCEPNLFPVVNGTQTLTVSPRTGSQMLGLTQANANDDMTANCHYFATENNEAYTLFGEFEATIAGTVASVDKIEVFVRERNTGLKNYPIQGCTVDIENHMFAHKWVSTDVETLFSIENKGTNFVGTAAFGSIVVVKDSDYIVTGTYTVNGVVKDL